MLTPTLSVALAEIVTPPATAMPFAGDVTPTTGGVVSLENVIAATVELSGEILCAAS
jgi:hypothetical protein